ncbi:hypothetical protein V6N13_148156 [Hibiscus sabdariffa]
MEESNRRVQKAGLASADVRLVLSFAFSKISVFYLVETVFPASVAIPLLIPLLFPHPNNRRMEVDRGIAVVRKVIPCITHHKLEPLYPSNDLEDYRKAECRSRECCTKREAENRPGKNSETPSANPKMMQGSGTILPSQTTSTAGFTTKLSPLQLLESIFPNQAVWRGKWDSATYPPNSNLSSEISKRMQLPLRITGAQTQIEMSKLNECFVL